MNCAEKIIRANNFFFQFIHQVTIEFRFRKSLVKSILEFRYQIVVSSIQFRKGLTIALFKKFLR